MTSPKHHLALAVSVAGAMIVALDGTVLTVAQPSLQRDLGAGVAQVQWTSTGYLLAAAGPVLGGAIVTRLGWRAVFVLNVPVALAIAALALLLRTPRTSAPQQTPERLDPTGALLLSGALAMLVGTLSTVPGHGWAAPATLLGLAATAGVAAAFAVRERRSAHPLVPTAVARSVPVTASMALLLATTAGMFGALFTVTFFLQDVRGLDPLASGLHGLPLTALMVLGAPVAGAALRRHGPRRTALTGITLVVLGIASLSRLTPGGGWALGGTAFAVLGAGYAAVMVSATGTVVGQAPPGYAGVIGGLKQTAMNIGPTLGIAVAASLVSSQAPATAALGSTGPGSTGPGSTGLAPALLALAAVAALGLLPAALLPTRSAPASGRPPAPQPLRTPGPGPDPDPVSPVSPTAAVAAAAGRAAPASGPGGPAGRAGRGPGPA
ncbi:MFS transporter [Kitasatospora sp. NPDC008050]|uniref:MFS transporter n=1 Tax=Kitasatospora sp. NPDC008050 TaxID=3364021 RepID=UPI0036F17C9D